MHSGLTVSPWANTASPAANTLCAALTSRSRSVPHSGQDQRRMCNGNWVKTWPQWLQRLLEGYQRSMRMNSRPIQRALYSSSLTSSTHPVSLMDLAKQRFFRMADTDKLSAAITWCSWINRVDRWCRKSLRGSAIFACPETLLPLGPRRRTKGKHLVIDHMHTTERASQRHRLLGCGIKPELVGTFSLHGLDTSHTKQNGWIFIQLSIQIKSNQSRSLTAAPLSYPA